MTDAQWVQTPYQYAQIGRPAPAPQLRHSGADQKAWRYRAKLTEQRRFDAGSTSLRRNVCGKLVTTDSVEGVGSEKQGLRRLPYAAGMRWLDLTRLVIEDAPSPRGGLWDLEALLVPRDASDVLISPYLLPEGHITWDSSYAAASGAVILALRGTLLAPAFGVLIWIPCQGQSSTVWAIPGEDRK